MHATPRPLIVPLFSSLSPLLFFLFYPLRLILARSCNRLVCYSREPINISFKCPFKRTKIVENRWKIRIDTCLVYNTKWYTHVTEFKNYSPLKKKNRKNNNNPSSDIRLLFSSLGFISRIIFESSRDILLSSPLSRRWFRKENFSSIEKKKNWCVGGTRSPLSKTTRLHPKQGREEEGGVEFFTLELARRNAGIGNYAVTTRGGVPTYYHLFSGRRNSPAPEDLVAKLTSS